MMAAEQQQRCGLAQSADPQPSKWGRRRQQRQHAASALKALAACDQSAVSRLGVSGRSIDSSQAHSRAQAARRERKRPESCQA